MRESEISHRRTAVPLAWASILVLVPLGLGCSEWPSPPRTNRDVVVDTIHGVEIADPYRWLEDQDAPEVRDWIAEQNAHARRVVSDTAVERELRERLTELMDTPDIGATRRAGDEEVFTMRRKGEGQARIYVRPASGVVADGSAPPDDDDVEEPDPEQEYEVLVDPADFGDEAVSVSIVDLSEDGRHMLFSVRDGGADEVSVRLYHIAERRELPDSLPRALYSGVRFDRAGDGFRYIHRSRSTGPRLRRHALGSLVADDEEIWGEGYGPTTFLSVSEIADGRYFLLGAQHGWASNDVFVMDRRTGEVHTVVEGEEAHFAARHEEGRLLLRTDLGARNYRILAVPMDLAPEQWSDRSRWRELLGEGTNFLRSYTHIEGRYFVTYLADVNSQIHVYEEPLPGAPWQRVGRVRTPQYHSAAIRGSGDGKALLTLQSFDVPPTEYEVDLATLVEELVEEPSVSFESRDYLVEQVFFPSADGTRSTMFIARRSDLEPNGDLPVLLHGYGGFNVAITPSFRPWAAAWMERGGVFAVATLRGGSEYGEGWHRGGMLGNKQNVFDDFIAAAEWLIAEGYTNPERLAITGTSNGGLLVAAALTQRPDLFKAVLCGLPDLDMVRFNTFTETNNMPALLEYGNAADPEQFAFLHEYSPYQAVEDGVEYPAVMLTQGDLDTRVPPLQARKMAARLQDASSSGLPVILHYDERRGHAGGRSRPKAISDTAMELTFLMTMLGMTEGG